jgi:4a-hydroxytetrahydrobiopterin dehydratase
MATHNQRLGESELSSLVERLPAWRLTDDQLQRSFEFPDFKAAIDFMTRAAVEAERLDHHPDWANTYSLVDVRIWSHELGGVSSKCVELAECMERIAAD